MEDYRSRSYADGRMEMEDREKRYPVNGMNGMRSYSASCASSLPCPRDLKMKRVKPQVSGSSSKCWSLNDPELQRKKRVASYKAYAVEGKVKGSFRNSFRWIKDRYTQIMYGWW